MLRLAVRVTFLRCSTKSARLCLLWDRSDNKHNTAHFGKRLSSRPLQSKKPFDSDVLGEFNQCVQVLVFAQWLAIDFNFER